MQLLWLPLAHSFGHALLACQLACGFVSAIDGRIDKIMDNAVEVRPTFMAAVPRIFEKAHARAVTAAAATGVTQAQLFEQVRASFGGRMRFFISGSAPLIPTVSAWFEAAGLLILEGYGLTESAGAGFINHPDHYRLGTVGLPFEGMSVRIGDDGEVQLHGPLVMAGYHHLPDATAAAFTEDGWLRTGDRGVLDADGFLSITGRIKDLFKTSGGKYVAPPAIEAKFMAICPVASRFMVFGEGRNFCVALMTLDPDAIAGWASDRGLPYATYADLVAAPEVNEMLDGLIGQVNADLNRWETIKRWKVLDHDLSIETGELTPSLKVKRSVVAERNKEILDAFYS